MELDEHQKGVYKGEVVDGMADGHGEWEDEKHAFWYVGGWRRNKFRGASSFWSLPNNFNPKRSKLYEGEYVDGLRNGTGTEYDMFANKTCTGSFVHGQKNGQGVLFYEEGGLNYKGEFVDDKPVGRGTAFVDGNFHGVGSKYYEGMPMPGYSNAGTHSKGLRFEECWVEDRDKRPFGKG